MPEPGAMPVAGPRASEGTVTLLTPTEDKPANLDQGGSPGRRVPPRLAALAAQFPGLRVEEMLCHDGKSLVAAGHAGDQPVVIKVLADGDPCWRHRQRHEIGVYQIFAEHPPPVRVPRLVHTDGHRIVVMERLEGTTLGTGRYPEGPHRARGPRGDRAGRPAARLAAAARRVRAGVRLPRPDRPLPRRRVLHRGRPAGAGAAAGPVRAAPAAQPRRPAARQHASGCPAASGRCSTGSSPACSCPGSTWRCSACCWPARPAPLPSSRTRPRRTGSEDAYLVNLAVVLSRERRIHLTLPEDHPLRLARLPAIDAAWARARERLRAAAGQRLFAPAGR